MIIFDTETNGLEEENSILSISAIKVKNGKIVETFNRFYFPKEPFNQDAIAVNGLNKEEITRQRNLQGNSYPSYFQDDMLSFFEFVKDETHFVGHNINFDIKMIKPIEIKHYFDTMKENINILKLRKPWFSKAKPTKDLYKYPKLIETAKFYNIDLNESELHESLYDVLITFEVFKKMSQFDKTKRKVTRFLAQRGSKPSIKKKFSYCPLGI